MGDMIIERSEEECLREQLLALKKEHGRLLAQNISLQQDLNNVIKAHNRAIKIIDRYIERNRYARTDRTRKSGIKASAKRKKL